MMIRLLYRLNKKLFKILAKNAPWNKLRILLFRAAGYYIGKNVYIGEDLIIIDELDNKNSIIIEDRVSIAARVTLVASSSPNFSKIRHLITNRDYGKIVIQNDAWIGTCAIILPNVTIEKCSIVGAGAVVTKDVKTFTIVAGVPAIVIKELI